MIDYLFRSVYRWAIWGLVGCLALVWLYWFRTDQLVASSVLVYTSGVLLLNLVLGYFSYDRHPFITRFIFYFSYALLLLITYSLYSVIRGIR